MKLKCACSGVECGHPEGPCERYCVPETKLCAYCAAIQSAFDDVDQITMEVE